MKNSSLYNIMILLGVTIVMVSCKSVPTGSNLLRTSWDNMNLKGKVKEVRTNFVTNYDRVASSNKEREFFLENDIRKNGLIQAFTLFNAEGYIKVDISADKDLNTFDVQIDTLTKKRDNYSFMFKKAYNFKDYKQKKNYKYPIEFRFPITDVFGLEPNHTFTVNNVKDTVAVYLDYELDKSNRIVESRKYVPVGVLNKEVQQYDKTLFFYNDKGQVIKKQFFPEVRNSQRRFATTNLEGFEISIDDSIVYYYTYTPSNQLKTVVLKVAGKKYFQEGYFYGKKGEVIRLERFKLKANPFTQFHTNKVIEYYDALGNIIQSENYNDAGVVVRTRYYEYEFDDHKNWVECHMYLEGKKEGKPTIIAKRKIEYYKNRTN